MHCLDTAQMAEILAMEMSIMKILVIFPSSKSFAKSVALADGQAIIERTMQAYPEHANIQTYCQVCVDRCTEWLKKRARSTGSNKGDWWI